MAETISLGRWTCLTPRTVDHRLRRAILLGSVAASLVLVGDQTFVRALGRTAAQDTSLALGLQPNLAMFLTFAVNVQQSIWSMSAWSFEVISLFVMGLFLLGGGRVLSRSGRNRPDSRDVLAPASRPAELRQLTARPDAAPLVEVPQRMAR